MKTKKTTERNDQGSTLPWNSLLQGKHYNCSHNNGSGRGKMTAQVNHEPIRLPETDIHWKYVRSYIEYDPDPDYQHASADAYEAFRDMKYGIRIHWGIYSIWGQPQESWPFLKMPDEKKQEYQELYKTFNPHGFSADEWMSLFKRVGLKCFAFTTKHHEGFSMFNTKTRVKQRVNWTSPSGPKIESCDLAYSIMETPFKRDIAGELCESARKHDIKIDLYYSHPDWYDADFRPYNYHPLQTPSSPKWLIEYPEFKDYPSIQVSDPTPEETARMIKRHRSQLTELLTNYGPIDMICLDQWFGPAVWPQIKKTIKTLRKIQPNVMFRARGIGNYGDYYTPEGFVPGSKENTNMPWMVIYPLARSFSYDADASQYKGSAWIIKNLVDACAKGGNFMVGIGPDADGKWHPRAVEDLEGAGKWLKINAEAIYNTRARSGNNWREGDDIRFTRTKDNKHIYAITLKWPDKLLRLNSVKPQSGSDIFLLGYPKSLKWHYENGIIINLPEEIQGENKRALKYAYAFKIRIE